MTCTSCGTVNPDGARFCNNCGSSLAASCPSCGAPVVSGARFCNACGAPQAAQEAPAARVAAATRPTPDAAIPARQPEAERRLVSVLFADLVGYTTLAEARDAEEVRELLTRYFDLASGIVARYGGVVEKFIGDAVMAVWGAPVATEVDAERAVRAALDLVDEVRSLAPGLQARAGVLTGEAAVTLGATNQGMVAGDLVNTASRLQGVAPPGSVLVGEATQRAAAAAIVFEPAGDQLLKGKQAPVAAWRAIRVVAERGGKGRSDTLEAPFTGRDYELRLLKDLFHDTVRDRRVRLVSLMGPAGIGKSRLAWEFLKYIDGLLDWVWWHSGRSPAYGQGLTFWALTEMVRARCRLVEHDDEATTRRRVQETLDEHFPDPAERAWIEPAILALLGVGGAPTRSEELFTAWRTFFERLAASDPVVMVFEDLHWADPGTLDFIDHLLDWSRGLPIYVVTLARPELLERRPAWGAGKRDFTSLSLEPLPPAAMEELISGLIPDLPAEAVRAVVTRAEGIPLYAVETVRMLVAEGRLELRDGHYAPVGDLGSLSVPETLTALILARLDALDPDDRALVQDAAVLGTSFTPAALAAVSGRDQAELESRLRDLTRRELFRLDTDPRSSERGQFAFVQALIREVAYNTLAKRDRKVRHLAAARYFERTGGEELAGALAAHYLAAHASSPEGEEADALASQARLALVSAAARASALAAHAQALGYLEQALTVAEHDSDRSSIHGKALDAAMSLGRYEEAERHGTEALRIARGSGDREAAALALNDLAMAVYRASHVERAQELLEAGDAEFGDLFPAPALLLLEASLARVVGHAGDPRRALAITERVLEAAELADAKDVVVQALGIRGSSLCDIGRTYEGLALIEATQRLAESIGDQFQALRALGQRGAYLGGDPRAALEAEREALELARRMGRHIEIMVSTSNAAEDAIRTGEWTWAREVLDRLLDQDLSPLDRAQVLGTRMWLRAATGEDPDADLVEMERLLAGDSGIAPQIIRADARSAVAFARGDLAVAASESHRTAALSPLNAPYVLPRAARAALWQHDRAAAAADLSAFEATGVHGPASLAWRLTIRAGIAALDGATSDAAALYRQALEAWREMGLPWDLALTAIDMAELLGPEDPEVRAIAPEARGILEGVGAKPYVARLDAALAGSASSQAADSARAGIPDASAATPA
jgi:class 3 adenylate cyclase/tetratricopeptide (TPR) repeat protein